MRGERDPLLVPATPPWWIRALALSSLLSTGSLIVLGSAVRVTDSGMGCRGWPLCSGAVGPITRFHPLMEQSHRFLASLVTVLIISMAVGVRMIGPAARHLRVPAYASLGVIGLQIILGAVTVVTNNAPFTVALHLLVATLFLGVVTVGAVASFVEANREWPWWRGVGRLGASAVSALYLVVISGSVVVNAGAQAACKAWPVCPTSASPTGLLVVQMLHRSIVLVGSTLVVVYLVSVLRSGGVSRSELRLSWTGLGLLAAQVAAGATSAMEPSHTELADVHLALAAALWSVVVAVAALRARGRVSAPTGSAAVASRRDLAVDLPPAPDQNLTADRP